MTMTRAVRGHLARHPWVGDALLVLAVAVLTTLFNQGRRDLPLSEPPSLVVALLIVTGSMTVLGRRRHPRAITVSTVLISVVMLSLDGVSVLFGPLLVALYNLALSTDRRTTIAYTAAAAVVLYTALVLASPGPAYASEKVAGIAWTLLPAAVGDSVRNRRGYLLEVEERARRAEQNREEEARRRVTEERTRIARELHDVVAHHIALANAQAGTASHLLAKNPHQAQEMLDELARTTSSALRELKVAVGLLRSANDPGDSLAPAPSLAQLTDLADSFRMTGLEVAVTRRGDARDLSPGVDLTAYRIIQEALTNVAKHAGVTRAEVEVRYHHDHLSVTVSDHGRGPAASPPPADGHGLIGMRERAASVGGHVLTGGRPAGGFQVVADLPLRTPDADAATGLPETGTAARP